MQSGTNEILIMDILKIFDIKISKRLLNLIEIRDFLKYEINLKNFEFESEKIFYFDPFKAIEILVEKNFDYLISEKNDNYKISHSDFFNFYFEKKNGRHLVLVGLFHDESNQGKFGFRTVSIFIFNSSKENNQIISLIPTHVNINEFIDKVFSYFK